MTATTPPVARPRAASSPPRRTQVAEGASLAVTALGVTSCVCLWVVLQVLFLGGLSQERDQAVLYQRFRAELAAATAPTGGVIEPGAPVALLRVPLLGLEQVVVEGTASGDLLAGPGHRRDTVLPGQAGVSLVYGRARSYGAPFVDITSLRPGDAIVAQTAQGRATYRVEGVRRTGDPVPPPPAVDEARLTLVTAEGSGRLAAFSPRSTVYVDASLVGKAFTPPPGRPPAVPDAERAMAVDTTALPLFSLSLGALAALVAGVAWLRGRWSLPLVWVIAAPLVISLGWATTDVAMRLLPNLL